MVKETSQVAELTAMLRVLRGVPKTVPLQVWSDSQYTVNTCTRWLQGWQKRGWVKADGKPVRNVALMRELSLALQARSSPLLVGWVPGHAGHPLNEAADALARAAAMLVRDEGALGPAGPGWVVSAG